MGWISWKRGSAGHLGKRLPIQSQLKEKNLINMANLFRTLGGHMSWVWAVAVTPDGARIVSGSDDNTVKVWDIESGRLVQLGRYKPIDMAG